MISTTIERLDFFLVAFIFVGQSFGNEYMMTCQRPVVTKSPRLLKLDLGLPCDLSKQSWCNLPGDKYPWHAVRSFVFENQGLMRRMYGEVRQLSVLRMEFNGNSIDENNSMGREFDELFKPISPTSSTTSIPSSSSSTQPPLVTQFTTTTESSSTGGNSFKSTSSPPTTTTAAEVSSSSTVYVKSNNVVEDDNTNSNSNNSDADKLSRNVNSGSSSNSAPVLTTSNLNGNVIGDDGGVTGASSSSNGNSLLGADTIEPFIKFGMNEEGYLSDQSNNNAGFTTTTEEGQTEGTTMQYNNDEADIFTTESIHHILFQDAERATTTSSMRPTTDDNNNFESSSSSASSSSASPPSSETTDEGDTPQQIHRSDIKGVNACPVKEEVVAPYWANNTRGEVLALLNLYPFEQYIHWEKCTFEHRQMYCREGCRCEQQYRLHRLLAFDPTNECRGIFSDWFRFPSCCVCKCYLTSSDLAQERFSFNRSPRFEDSDIPDVNGVDDSHFYYKSTGFNSRQPRR